MSDQAQGAGGADPEIDDAFASHDPIKLRYVLAQRAFRRRVTCYLLVVFLIGGSAMIAFGLVSDAAAKRISEIANVIGTFMGSIAMLLSAIFGAGAFDNRSFLGGGMGGMSGVGGMYGGYGGMSTRRSTSAIAPGASSAVTVSSRAD